MVNKGKVPSEAVIKEHVKEHQEDYRFETKKHPVKRFQSRKRVPKY
jgi:hypothetical protein